MRDISETQEILLSDNFPMKVFMKPISHDAVETRDALDLCNGNLKEVRHRSSGLEARDGLPKSCVNFGPTHGSLWLQRLKFQNELSLVTMDKSVPFRFHPKRIGSVKILWQDPLLEFVQAVMTHPRRKGGGRLSA